MSIPLDILPVTQKGRFHCVHCFYCLTGLLLSIHFSPFAPHNTAGTSGGGVPDPYLPAVRGGGGGLDNEGVHEDANQLLPEDARGEMAGVRGVVMVIVCNDVKISINSGVESWTMTNFSCRNIHS